MLAVLVLGGSLYGLWELSVGLGPGEHAPLSRSHPGPEDGGALRGPSASTMDAPPTATEPEFSGSRPSRGAITSQGHPAVFEPAPDGPSLRRRLAAVARTFRTATPDLGGLGELIRTLAERSTILTPTLERSRGRIAGRVQLQDTDLEADFEVNGTHYRVRFIENSFETVHPPYLRLELELTFDTDARQLNDTRATLAFAPNPSRKSLDHLGLDEELRIGWKVLFGPTGASARGIGARVASDLETWDIGPSEKTRANKRLRVLSSFQAWRALLPAVSN